MELGWCKLSSKDQFQVVGIKVDNDESDITKAVQMLKKRLEEIKNRVDSTIFCVNPLEKSSFFVCVEVQNANDIPHGMVTITVPAQDYAVFVYNQTTINFRDSYEQKYRWLKGWTHLKQKPSDVFILEYLMHDGTESYLPYVAVTNITGD